MGKIAYLGVNPQWDSRLTERQVKKIFRDPEDPRFYIYAEKLLSRVNDPKKVFDFMGQETFCRKWPVLKQRMKKDAWADQRVRFWQTMHERVLVRLKAEGIKIRKTTKVSIPPVRDKLAQQIKGIRQQLGYTQKDMAKK